MSRSKKLDKAYENAQDNFRDYLFQYEPSEWNYWNTTHRGIEK